MTNLIHCLPVTCPAPQLPPALRRQLDELVRALRDETRLLALSCHLSLEGDYPRAPHCYSRTILHRSPQGEEVMVARWEAGARSPVHGHPELAFVRVLEGKLQIENFRWSGNALESTDIFCLERGDHIWHQGVAGRFDNAIHRVTALEPSLSLHVYSDDALKGRTF